ncbi:MAG: hypothetical protein JST11_17685 [Acidobacteria bacterium]|nr:hypothetical protein [Acidobacteriota bacterium]
MRLEELRGVAILPVIALLLAGTAEARIVKLDIQSRSDPAPDGYVTIAGRAYGEVDPANPLNAIVQDISLAPRNSRGMVEYSMDFTILKPQQGNGLLLYDVVNRGFPLSRLVPPLIEGMARQRGYTMVWSGWEGNLPKVNPIRHTMTVPTATQGGKEITGWVWFSFDVSQPSPSTNFALAPLYTFNMYEPADLNAPDSELTRRRGPDDTPVVVPRADWAFASCDAAHPFPGVSSSQNLCLKGGLNPQYAYTLRYRAKNPLVMGLGPASIRDLVSFLRHNPSDDAGNLNPVDGTIKASIMHGLSQSGHLVRTFLSLGFNQDETGRTVFEGLNPVISASRVDSNVRFALPILPPAFRLAHLRPAMQSPFTWMPEYDFLAGRFGWLLERSMQTGSFPKIMHVFSSSEYWNQRASLTVTEMNGRYDAWIPGNVRIYHIAGTQHTPAAFPPTRGVCQQLMNPNDWTPHLRALLVALEQWVLQDVEPPPSEIPTVAAGNLVQSDARSIGWPEIPGVNYTGRFNPLPLVDFGPEFDAVNVSGVLGDRAVVNPGMSYQVLVPKVDSDGNEIAGVRPASVQVPIATYTGWNLQAQGFAEGELCMNTGSYIPFPNTKAERAAARDPRLSLEERYRDHAAYVEAVRLAAGRLVSQRFLLPADANSIIAQAEASTILVPKPTVTLAVTGPQNGNAYKAGDSFILTITAPAYANKPVSVAQNGAGPVQLGVTDAQGNWSVSGTWGATDIGSYTQAWYVAGIAATPTLTFSVTQ